MAVAVITGSDFRCDVWFPECHRFAVIGFAIMSETVLMALAATLIAHHFEMAVSGSFNPMSCVAIGTDGAALISFQQQLPMNTFVVGLFNLYMAFPTSPRHICVIDGRIAIDTSFDVVNTVAIIA